MVCINCYIDGLNKPKEDYVNYCYHHKTILKNPILQNCKECKYILSLKETQFNILVKRGDLELKIRSDKNAESK